MAADKEHAHHLLDQLAPGQLAAVVHLLETMLSPEEDEALSSAERKAVADAEEWLSCNRPLAHKEVLADCGLSMADWETMGQEPLLGKTPRHDG